MSNIDPSKPIEGLATTQSVRDNFQAAADEIDAAQAKADNSVQLTGNQSISGQKTFTVNPVSSGAQNTAAAALTRKDYVDQAIADAIATIGATPVGMISPFAHELSAPNWLYCNGQAISRATYAALFAAIGTNYGGGDFTTTFNLPDYRGKFLRAQDDGAGRDPNAATRTPAGTEPGGDNVGSNQTGALQTHQHAAAGGHAHTATQPTHNHTASQAAHSHTLQGSTSFQAAGTYGGRTNGTNLGTISPLSSATPAITVVASSAGAITVNPVADHQHPAAGSSTENRPINQYIRYYVFAGVG